MKIISCHITGYGKFNNADFDFTDGLNVIEEDNGRGKTTLCSFLNAMFYGNPASREKKRLFDRKKYRPWDNSAYGGSLIFEANGKRYRVERFFGAKENDDTFALFDLDTNLESDDYSENLGEELFKIDRDSFAKSVYVPQSDLKPQMTGAINSKLGDLVTVQDDINNFDAAIKRIDDETKIYTKNGKDDTRGLILKLKDDINILKEDADRLDSYEESLVKNEELLSEKQKIRAALEKERHELREKIVKQSERERLRGEYNSALKTYNTEKESLDTLDDFFANGLPEDDEINEYFELAKEVDVLQGRCDDIQKKMPDTEKTELLKKLFDEPLDDATIDDWLERANKLSELRVLSEHAQLSAEDKDTLQELKYYFTKKKPTKEELDIVRTEAENVNRLQGRVEESKGHYEQNKHAFEEAEKNNAGGNKSGLAMYIIIAAVVLIGSVVTITMVGGMTGLIMGVAGIIISAILLFVGILGSRKSKTSSENLMLELEKNYNEAKDNYEQIKTEYETSEQICREFLSDFLVNANDTMQQMISDIELKSEKYDTLLANEEKAVEVGGNALEELTSYEMSLYTELTHYQSLYGMEDLYSSNAEVELIQRIKEDNKLYIDYVKDDKERTSIIEQREANLKKIASYLNKFPVINEDNMHQKIAYVSSQKKLYEDVSEKVFKHKEFIEKYEEENKDYIEAETIEELQKRQAEIDEELRSVGEDINKTHILIRDVRDNIESCQESSNQIDELKEQLEEYNKKVSYLKQTAKYLKKAKEKFLSTYMRPLQKGMREYLDRIDTKGDLLQSEDFRIDTTLSISIVHEGSSKEESYLSQGYQDLASFCSRLALIDIMYEEQKPMIILDDPFTNFDADKIKMVRRLIDELAENIQIIYFTCHESRA